VIYFQCPDTKAGVLLPIDLLKDGAYVEWLKKNLEEQVLA
jgi:hypothetical protein